MSDRDATDAAAGGDEPLLARWSRLKAKARVRQAPPAAPDAQAPPATAAPAVAVVGDPAGAPAAAATPAHTAAAPASDAAAAPSPPAVELPDIDQLHQDSDYSAFLTPGVDAELRKRALRKLFHSPKFNVFDGLDTYRDDFTSFPVLGDIVTADMRYHVERAAKELAARAEAALADDSPAPAVPAPRDAAVAALPTDPPSTPAATALPVTPPVAPCDTPTEWKEDDAEHGPA